MSSAWAPLRRPLYRALWIAQFVSNVGTWMQTVGAQWLIGSQGGSSLQVALVQAATTLPVFLVGLPAGALGDIVDRRRLLIFSQSLMVVAAGALAALTFADAATPWLLLAFTFTLGLGAGLMGPSWQAIVPELVSDPEITLAAALAGVNMNLARALGPAVGGLVVAAAGPAWTFALNAVSFLGVLAVIVRWRRVAVRSSQGAEHIGAAMRIGLSYARHAPRLRSLLVRAALFAMLAGSLWALLPIFVRRDLQLGSGGYGLLLAGVGVGAILGALALARMQTLISTNGLVIVASIAFAAACGICAATTFVAAVALAMPIAGAAWVTATSVLNGTTITLLPAWVRSRGAAVYTLVFQGGQTLGAIAGGVVAQAAGARTALAAAGGGLLLSAAASVRGQLPAPAELDVDVNPWPVDPPLALTPDNGSGPVLVTVDYQVPAEHHSAFRVRMLAVGRARRRTGAERWGLFQDGSDPDCFTEVFVVATWKEHLRQHGERSTGADRAALSRALELTSAAPRVRHLIHAYRSPPEV